MIIDYLVNSEKGNKMTRLDAEIRLINSNSIATRIDVEETTIRLEEVILKSKQTIIIWMVCINLILCVSLIVSMKYFTH